MFIGTPVRISGFSIEDILALIVRILGFSFEDSKYSGQQKDSSETQLEPNRQQAEQEQLQLEQLHQTALDIKLFLLEEDLELPSLYLSTEEELPQLHLEEGDLLPQESWQQLEQELLEAAPGAGAPPARGASAGGSPSQWSTSWWCTPCSPSRSRSPSPPLQDLVEPLLLLVHLQQAQLHLQALLPLLDQPLLVEDQPHQIQLQH